MKPDTKSYVEKRATRSTKQKGIKGMKTIFALLLAFLISTACTNPTNSLAQSPGAPPRREIAITFDDLPATFGDWQRATLVTKKLLQSLKANHVPAIGFVNERKLYLNDELDPRMVATLHSWLDAGFELGNHTYSHIAIDQVPLERYKEDVIRGEVVTRNLLAEKGMALRYFRHTQLRTGPTEEYKKGLSQFLAERGYTVAPVTIDNNDFIFQVVYAEAKTRGDKALMKRVGDAYIPYMESVFEHFEKLSKEFLGYEVKQTLLLHANDLNADYFDELARMMKRRGYRFISLEEALKDKAYGLPEAQAMKGLSWIHRWMLAKGLQMKPEPTEPEFVSRLFNTRQR
jgi:peptidoglycan/xylan/chitin deacetylase (PgdA/CDA1 family)